MKREDIYEKLKYELADKSRDELLWLLADSTLAVGELSNDILRASGLEPDEPANVIE